MPCVEYEFSSHHLHGLHHGELASEFIRHVVRLTGSLIIAELVFSEMDSVLATLLGKAGI
jgi:hypothetical protein